MNGLHGQQKRTKGQRRNAGGQRFYGYRERPQLQRKDAADQRCGDNFRTVQPFAGKGAPDQPAHKTTVERHIPDVGPQRHQAAVGKQQALDEQHADHRQKRGVGTHDGGQQHAAAQMTAGTRAGDGKIDHLGGKNKGTHHAHHGHGLVIGLLVQLAHRAPRRHRRTGVHDSGNTRRQ